MAFLPFRSKVTVSLFRRTVCISYKHLTGAKMHKLTVLSGGCPHVYYEVSSETHHKENDCYTWRLSVFIRFGISVKELNMNSIDTSHWVFAVNEYLFLGQQCSIASVVRQRSAQRAYLVLDSRARNRPSSV